MRSAVLNISASLLLAIGLMKTVEGYSEPFFAHLFKHFEYQYSNEVRLKVEYLVLVAYFIGLLAFPSQIIRRVFKFCCLFGSYLLLMKPISQFVYWVLEIQNIPSSFLTSIFVQFYALALVILVGYLAYQISWSYSRNYPSLEGFFSRENKNVCYKE